MNNNVSIYPTSESVRNRHFEKTQIIKRQSCTLLRLLISEYPGYSLISEPITVHEKHYSLVGYMLTVDIYFLLSNQSVCKMLFTCFANTNACYPMGSFVCGVKNDAKTCVYNLVGTSLQCNPWEGTHSEGNKVAALGTT